MNNQPEWMRDLKSGLAVASTALVQEVEEALDPVAGKPIVGDLTDEEQARYVVLYGMEQELDAQHQELVRRHLERSVGNVIENLEHMTLSGIIEIGRSVKFFESDAEASAFFHANSRAEFHRAQFWYLLRERLNIWTQSLGIRKGWRVVSTGHKYKQ